MNKEKMYSRVLTSWVLFGFIINEATGASKVFKTWKFEDCSFQNAERCAQIIFIYGYRDIYLPDNERDMKPHCAEEKSAVTCLKKWGRNCLKPVAKQFLGIVMQGASKNVKQRCGREGSAWYLKNAKCVIDSAPNLHTCIESISIEIGSIRQVKAKEKWFPLSCCLLDKVKKCFNKGAKPFCTSDGIKFINWAFDSNVHDLSSLFCGDEYGIEGTKCQALTKLMPTNSTKTKPSSLFEPIFRLGTELADFTDEEIFSKLKN